MLVKVWEYSTLDALERHIKFVMATENVCGTLLNQA